MVTNLGKLYNNSLTWNKAILGWFPLLTMIPVRSRRGHYNLPRLMVILLVINGDMTGDLIVLNVGNPGCHKELPWLGMVYTTHKMMMTWGWFTFLGLPHYIIRGHSKYNKVLCNWDFCTLGYFLVDFLVPSNHVSQKWFRKWFQKTRQMRIFFRSVPGPVESWRLLLVHCRSLGLGNWIFCHQLVMFMM